jgi:hypothetical protein
VIVPVWADEFSVQFGPDGDYLITTEDGVFPTLAAEENSLGLLDFMKSYYEAPRRTRETSRGLPYLRFTNATDEEKLLQFLKEFGPVHAQTRSGGLGLVTAVQSRSVLRAEQEVFAAARELVSVVNDLADFSREWAERDLCARPPRIERSEQSLISKIAPILKRLHGAMSDAIETSDSYKLPNEEWKELVGKAFWDSVQTCDVDNLSKAHRVLCEIFNAFPPKLFFAGGDVIEAPELALTGIRPLLYFMLREIYLLKVRIRRCQREDCGHFFIPDRINGDYCSVRCGDLVRQRNLNERRAKEVHTTRSRTHK